MDAQDDREIDWGSVRGHIERRLGSTIAGAVGFDLPRPLYVAYEQNPSLVEQWLKEEYPRIHAQARKTGAEIYFDD